jgi:hypothetical protein
MMMNDMMNPNDIVLVTREEINQLTANPISDNEWEQIREDIISHDDLWSHIDRVIKEAIELDVVQA